MTIEEKHQQYLELCHAMQTGIAYILQKNPASGSAKHLRVGINNSMVQHAALVNLLVKKGIITLDEYYDSLIEFMEKEVKSYQDELKLIYGVEITLS